MSATEARENLELLTGMAGTRHGIKSNQGARDLAALNQKYGTQQNAYAGLSELEEAMRSGKMDFGSGILQTLIQSVPASMSGLGDILKGIGEIAPG